MILIYAFSNRWATNVSRLTLTELQKIFPLPQINYQLVSYLPKDFFRKFIEHNQYQLIIGLGDGPKFSDHIHIETQTKNSYNDQSIYPFSPIFLDLNLPNVDIYDPRFFKISSSMGTYNCNYLAYLTQLYINQHSPSTLHLFLHLPPRLNATLLANNIADLLKQNQMLQ
jgi:hypothetical protein